MKEVYSVSARRTPLGSWGGGLSTVSATEMGAIAIEGALKKAQVSANLVQEVFMGNVVSANLGQAPARQAAIAAGISTNAPATTINKVCASGMKAITLAAQSIMLGHNEIIVAGGMENMSQIPFYVPKARFGYKFGNAEFVDGLVRDGLQDVYNKKMMGIFSDATATKYGFSREEIDQYAINSYHRAAKATSAGLMAKEITPVTVKGRKGEVVVVEDEEFKNVKFEKIPTLRPAFSKNGTTTAANASTINDGAAALVLISGEKLKELGLNPLARIVSFADAANEPAWFTTAPSKATPIALKRAGLKISDIDFFEVNEAFSVVPMAYNKDLGLDPAITNIYGGAVSLGHPLGASGARIVTTLNNVLQNNNSRYGCAAICNGGGGATSLIIEKI